MFHTDSDGVYRWQIGNLKAGHDWCQMKVRTAMQKDIPTIIVSNTFTTNAELRPYRELASQHGYEVEEITIDSGLTDEELHVRNIHGVPVETITKMRTRWQE
jgi:predicted kinase